MKNQTSSVSIILVCRDYKLLCDYLITVITNQFVVVIVIILSLLVVLSTLSIALGTRVEQTP